MSNLILQSIITGKPLTPVTPSTGENRPLNNPFLQSNGNNGGAANQGLNQPLRQPMFVGYRDNKPLYAGSRLFVLY
jgi:hypothetical protein